MPHAGPCVACRKCGARDVGLLGADMAQRAEFKLPIAALRRASKAASAAPATPISAHARAPSMASGSSSSSRSLSAAFVGASGDAGDRADRLIDDRIASSSRSARGSLRSTAR